MTEILSVTIMTVKIIVTGKYPAFFRFQDISAPASGVAPDA